MINKEIAGELRNDRAGGTVKAHRHEVMEKMRVKSFRGIGFERSPAVGVIVSRRWTAGMRQAT